MIREIQHYVLLQHCFCYAHTMLQSRMCKRLYNSFSLRRKYIWKVHEVPEVVNATARYNVVSTSKVQALYKVFKQAAVHFFVIHKAGWLSFAPVLQTLFYLLYKVGREVGI